VCVCFVCMRLCVCEITYLSVCVCVCVCVFIVCSTGRPSRVARHNALAWVIVNYVRRAGVVCKYDTGPRTVRGSLVTQ